MALSEIGHIVAEKRKALGWTQQDLADRADVSRDMISRFENGSFEEFGVRKLARICMALKLDLTVNPLTIDRVKSLAEEERWANEAASQADERIRDSVERRRGMTL